eukprot:CAMPEP_0197620054 /NCGR_PEP_ID=MMETSP1338-20131121/945_1 /TAXON_ID=43686 ORGANISM="Pelagodinium beii, Strain RCC1491" /NCGR_SAMPLE_ID=MMETSP1338 /ASSEMBLY_ACC=CAM_ASM_000754 /LENGTH=81 /DNA_ID=CAMNT_0043189123 /DNA_START=33 /DNA_END=275 /DNA_ORIENTATION=-
MKQIQIWMPQAQASSLGVFTHESTWMVWPANTLPFNMLMACATSSVEVYATVPVPAPLPSKTSHHLVLPAFSMCSWRSFQR